MKQVLLSGVLSLLAIILLPGGQAEPSPLPVEDRVLLIQEAEQPPTLTLLDVGVLEETEYLTCVVLSEMPAGFEPEALKAQAVAARTFLYRQKEGGKHEAADVCPSSGCCQAWSSREALEQRLGESFAASWDKARQAVTETAGEILTYRGRCIDATYFSCSGGRTEAAVAVWGSEVPYLQSVESFGEEAAPRYESTSTFYADDFRSIILAHASEVELGKDPASWLGPCTRTEGGGVDAMEIGGVPFSGTQLRQMFFLNSTDFTLEFRDGDFVFSVHGYGHRVGMSQYGANFMAQQGYGYRKILLYYYQGVKVEKIHSA